MNTTVRMKQSEVYKDWHVIDAAGRPLGRVATEVASLLKGKHKPTYEPHLDDGDFVIVVNASQVRVTGNKANQKTYYRHSGYPGGLKSRSYTQQFEKFPERVLEQAIWGMLPKGPLGKQMFKHLKVYKGLNHPHQSQLAGTVKAQEARTVAQSELATVVPKVKRLRPLSVPQEQHLAAAAAPKPSPAASAARAAKARVRGATAAAPAIEEAAPVAAVAAAEVIEAPKRASRRKTEVEAVATEAVEAPKRAPRRKAVEATAETATEETPKPARRRAAAKSEGTEE
ncbi:MAG: 50S ribosomal protein L13 [Dehalococcoidia bacterium]|nr:50S ribosomal protein L13 [Dehalococcoidia bacterium]MBK6563492.1 50S ribosomal protein L13 [Dehalococcoidia bacterium]MBK7724853.1 50S ribosomal protein L13 [Dehalococcoidia bacterium]MBK9544819.1 50S ribosomal protein L13 [Dehalococcoidia bacterium]MBK9611407.1 50S ribosomal protein L13 [Dehalococcoidia bacterium]